MEQIKAWFLGLDDKEQKMTMAAAAFVGLLIVYTLIIGPINNAAASLEAEVAAHQKIVDWMKKKVPIILSKSGARTGNSSGQSLSSIVNKSAKKFHLPVSRRDSKKPNEMQIWFDNVSFDSFLRWVAEVNSKYGVTVVNVNIRKVDADGITSINVKLQK